ncbi:hypothetical protein LTS10_011981 [Elasticomyces elasticus]|nr:hypothetical protein LTS10_011981 [Elasticomyces elasticus]
MAFTEHSVPVAQICVICGTNPDGHLLRCSGCDHVRYCGKTCQKKHWSYHKLVCKRLIASSPPARSTASSPPGSGAELLGREGLIRAVHTPKLKRPAVYYQAIMLGQNGSHIGLDFKLGSRSSLYKFQEMPVTSAFRIPLLMKLLPMPGIPGPHRYEKNFSVDPDPKSPTFGESLLTASTEPPTRLPLLPLLMRKDGGYLQVEQMVTIMSYLVGFVPVQVFGEIKRGEAAGEFCDREVLTKQRLTPRTFGLVFDVAKEDALKGPEKECWEDVECPVPITTEGDLAEPEGNLTAMQWYAGYMDILDKEEPMLRERLLTLARLVAFAAWSEIVRSATPDLLFSTKVEKSKNA